MPWIIGVTQLPVAVRNELYKGRRRFGLQVIWDAQCLIEATMYRRLDRAWKQLQSADPTLKDLQPTQARLLHESAIDNHQAWLIETLVDAPYRRRMAKKVKAPT